MTRGLNGGKAPTGPFGRNCLLRLPGLDGSMPAGFHGGRSKQPDQFGGSVIEELIA